MSGSTEDLIVQMMGMTNAAFERVVVAEAKGEAGPQITEALESDVDLCDRWIGNLSRIIARNVSNLAIEDRTHNRGDKWAVGARRFLGGIEARKAEAQAVFNRLYREHRVHELEAQVKDLRQIIAESFKVMDDCEGEPELSDRQWDLVDDIVPPSD